MANTMAEITVQMWENLKIKCSFQNRKYSKYNSMKINQHSSVYKIKAFSTIKME